MDRKNIDKPADTDTTPVGSTEIPHRDAGFIMNGGIATPIDNDIDVLDNQGVEVEDIDEEAAKRRRKD